MSIIRQDILTALKTKLATISTAVGSTEIVTVLADREFTSDTNYWDGDVASGTLAITGGQLVGTAVATNTTNAILANGLTHSVVLSIASYSLFAGIVYGNRTYLFENTGAQTISIVGDGSSIKFVGTFALNSISILQTGASLTYSTTIVKVHDKPLDLNDVSPSDFPSLAVVPLTEKVIKGESLREHTWNVMLIGYISVDQDTTLSGKLSTEYEKVYNDVQLLVDANPTLGVEGCIDVEITGLAPWLDDNDTKGFFTIDVQIIYVTDF